ncbi:MAG: hypothetical protein IV100_07635 [Myxococcales bacterium]|nr:hypothetical protein [Myxococcales bacterium]
MSTATPRDDGPLIGGVVGGVLAALLLALIVFFVFRARNKPKASAAPSESEMPSSRSSEYGVVSDAMLLPSAYGSSQFSELQ